MKITLIDERFSRIIHETGFIHGRVAVDVHSEQSFKPFYTLKISLDPEVVPGFVDPLNFTLNCTLNDLVILRDMLQQSIIGPVK